MSEADRFEVLVEAWCNGTLEQRQANLLLAMVEDDPRLQREFLAAARIHGLLDAHLRVPGDAALKARVTAAISTASESHRRRIVTAVNHQIGPATPRRQPRSASRGRPASRAKPRRSVMGLVALSVLVVLGGWVWLNLTAPSGDRVAHVAGDVTVVIAGEQRVVERPLALPADSNWQLALSAQASADIELGAGGSVLMAGPAVLGFQAETGRYLLERGRADVVILPRQPDHQFQIQTADATVTVLGTGFQLAAERDHTRLMMHHGQVRVDHRHSDHSETVSAPDEVTIDRLAIHRPEQIWLVTGHQHAGGLVAGLDQALSARGLTVTTVPINQFTPASLQQRSPAAVVLLDTIESKRHDLSWLTAEPVPVVCFEAFLFPQLGLTGGEVGVDYGERRDQTELVRVTESTAETVLIDAEPTVVHWGRPEPSARVWAHVPDQPSQVAWFSYDSGAALADGTRAAGPRVGSFIALEADGRMTWQPAAISMIEEAVRWAVEAGR